VARAHRDARQQIGLDAACLESRTMFEQADAILLAALILQSRFDEPWPQRCAHDRHVFRDRVVEHRGCRSGE
jgi:hypothetical protein